MPNMPSLLAPPLEIYLLGLVELNDALRLQRRIVYDLGEAGAGASLILCEHPPTVSIGRSGSRFHIAADDDELRERAVGVQWVNRGGGCNLHLPGQVAGYLALSLQAFGMTLGGYIDGLHQALINSLAEFDLRARADAELPGVFLGRRRVATVGIAVTRWIAYYGFTLNVGPYLDEFGILEEPGLEGEFLRQTSMEAVRQRPAPMARVRETLIRNLESQFGLERHHVYTDHPMIRRKPLLHVYAQSLG